MLHMSIKAPVPAATSTAGRHPSALLRARGAVDHRAEALWRTAPFLAGLSLCCALVALWSLVGRVPAPLLGGWGVLVVAVNAAMLRARRRAADPTASGPARSGWRPIAEAAGHAALWSTLPAAVFAGQPAATQALLGAAMGTMMAGAFLLAIVPLAATAWVLAIAIAFVWALHAQGGETLASGIVLLSVFSAVVIAGCLTIERLLARQVGVAHDERERGEAIGLLLREYEEQGAGWLWQTDAHHQLTYVSPRICDRLGRSTAQLLGHSLPVLLGCDAKLGQALAARVPFAGVELPIAAAMGECWMSLSASPIFGVGGEFEGFRGLGSDVTEVRRAQDRIRRVALMDDLTGLPNRQQVRGLVTEAIAYAERRGSRAALLFADLDGFKAVNDRFGHAAGDAALRAVAERLARVAGTQGQVGRLGGDEFAIVMAQCDSREMAEALGHRLIKAVAEPVDFGSGALQVGLSIGCVFAPTDGGSVDELLVKADIALYQAKSRGRGRLTLFDKTMQRDAEERVLLERDLRQALARDQLKIEYQPVIDVETQAIVGFEALIRWAHPERGLVPPAIFVPIAEECGLIAGIGEWVIRTACTDAASWPGSIFVSVNVSRVQLELPGLPSVVGEALVATRLQPARLELEVTENVFQGESAGPLDVLRRLRALGVGIALDDFGSGYSSLGYLNRTIFHTLKLDGSFVRDAAHKSETLAVIRAIVALAKTFRMDVTAEGIESFEDFARMKDLGCKRVQGYLFGRPAPRAQATALLLPADTRAAE
ncbi:putative bifunctional diguanylate cyclase/phosphodiesterase [Sphingomonas profundi]|uniref:putative bifunctional diguanylate cyclase/phosphodiesterase n=1 Tax=Alterirhizorhabdus profundi TaxID=2681549 RepID=UPI0012E977A3|nr:GGDEF and EAL domain-containing protein [Sphingomonas profundi]